jgi:hypothetical protein
MFKRVAQEITRLLADEYDRRPSETQRLVRARLVASIAEGLDGAPIADTGAGLSDGLRAAFLDARLSPEERHVVVGALLRDPGDRAEMSSAAVLLDGIDAEPSPLPRDLLAHAATTFVKSAADQTVIVGGQRAFRRGVQLALATSLAAVVLIMALVPGFLSPAGNKIPAPFAETTGSVRPPTQSAATASESVAGGHATDRTIVLRPEAIERARSISERVESSAVPCDDGHEVACGSQAPATDSHSIKPQPRFDGPSLRAVSSRQSNDFRLGMIVDSLYAIPDGLFEIAGRALSLFGELGKRTLDLVDPRCFAGQHQTHASKSRGKLSSISRKDSRTPQWCAFSINTPIAASRVANKDRVQ